MRFSLSIKLASILAVFILNVYSGEQIFISEPVDVSDFVGSEFYGYVDGVGDKTMFQLQSSDRYMSVANDGSMFLIDGSTSQQRIRKITKDGTVSTVASPTAIPSQIINPNRIPFVDSMVYFGNNSFLVWNYSRDAIFKVDEKFTSASIYKNGLLSDATKILGYFSRGVCVDKLGNTYFSTENKVTRLGGNDFYEVFVGSGNTGFLDGNGIFSSFSGTRFLTSDSENNIYVYDIGNACIRRIDQNRNVTWFSGVNRPNLYSDGPKLNAVIGTVNGIACDKNDNIIFSSGYAIRRIDKFGNVQTIAGDVYRSGHYNGIGSVALFREPKDLVCIDNDIFVFDRTRIRKITIGQDSTKKPIDNISIKLSAGVTINGTVGKKYSIESSSDGGKQWNQVIEIDLQKTPYTWYDEKSVGTNNLYRVFETP